MIENLFLEEWRNIAEDLGLRVEFDFTLRLSEGELLYSPVRLLDFGAVNGMLLFSSSSQLGGNGAEVVRRGYGFSVLSEPSPESVRNIDFDVIKDVLRDWGWAGEEGEMPDWVCGE